jgi:tRNA (guanine37-N1)-methyltransferase
MITAACESSAAAHLHVNILTLFPDMFPGTLAHSIAGKALKKGIWSYKCTNIRNYAYDKHGNVDDTPCGGGAGLVLRPDVIDAAIKDTHNAGLLIYFTPRGQKIDQPLVRSLAQEREMTFLCGRYEGVDQRIFDSHSVLELSLGDFILSGGELPAQVLLDAIIRLLPGVVGKQESLDQESFETGLLEHPLYTRPQVWNGMAVPEVLMSGHHAKIAEWQQRQSEDITRQRRPDLWSSYVAAKNKDE